MKFRETLAKVQTENKCNHVEVIGEPCDRNSGGWWTCGCAVIADKMVSEFHNQQLKQEG